ncbi:MAG: toxin-antitoxin system YwqK family antitoxin [Thermodesulfobacteriota bacterium]
MVKRLIVMIAVISISTASYADTLNPICNKNPNGIMKDYYSNGQVKTEWGCKDGHLNGISKLYYKNGQLEKESNYVNDVL